MTLEAIEKNLHQALTHALEKELPIIAVCDLPLHIPGSTQQFWDLDGVKGYPLRCTVSEMGPTLISYILQLNDLQKNHLHTAFRIADNNGFLLIDNKDLIALIQYMLNHSKDLSTDYGAFTKGSLSAILRRLYSLDASFSFGEPSVNIEHLLPKETSAQAHLNILRVSGYDLMSSPRHLAITLWLLTELSQHLRASSETQMILYFPNPSLLSAKANQPMIHHLHQLLRSLSEKGVLITYFETQGNHKDQDSSSFFFSDAAYKAYVLNQLYRSYYETILDRHSAYEMLAQQAQIKKTPSASKNHKKVISGAVERFVRSMMTSIGRQVGNAISRGILETMKKHF